MTINAHNAMFILVISKPNETSMNLRLVIFLLLFMLSQTELAVTEFVSANVLCPVIVSFAFYS